MGSRRLKITLRWLLPIWIIGGAGIGLWLRWYINTPTFHRSGRGVNGFAVEAMWERRLTKPDRLVYLLAYPTANTYGGGTTPLIDDTPATHGVEIHPAGLHVKGINRTADSNVKFWLYLSIAPDGDVQPLEKTLHYPELTREDFAKLETLPVWKEVVFPALKEETELRGWKLPKKATPPANSPGAVGEQGGTPRQTALR